MRFGAAFVLTWTLPAALAAAQADVSVGAGVGTVRSSDGATFTAGSFSPSVTLYRAAGYFGAHGSLAALPDGQWNVQLHSDTWTRLGRSHERTGVALVTSFGGTALPGDARAASLGISGELFRGTGASGVAVAAGPEFSALAGAAPLATLRLRSRAWQQRRVVQYQLNLEVTRLRGASYGDAEFAATFTSARGNATVAAISRLAEGTALQATARAFVAWRFADRWSLEGGVGGFLSDPFLGFARARAANMDVRFHWGRRAKPLPQPLVAARRGDSVEVRIRVNDASSVAIAGDWSSWSATPLRESARNVWSATLVIAPGTYRFNLIVDGKRWIAPPGVSLVTDDLGGQAGVLIVPAH
jgi:hypothetical protein